MCARLRRRAHSFRRPTRVREPEEGNYSGFAMPTRKESANPPDSEFSTSWIWDQRTFQIFQEGIAEFAVSPRNARPVRPGGQSLISSYLAHVDRHDFYTKRRRHRLYGTEHTDAGGYCRVANDCGSSHDRRDLFEQLEPFPGEAVLDRREPGGVAAGSRKAIDKPGADRVSDQYKHNRHRPGRIQQWSYGRRAIGENNVWC